MKQFNCFSTFFILFVHKPTFTDYHEYHEYSFFKNDPTHPERRHHGVDLERGLTDPRATTLHYWLQVHVGSMHIFKMVKRNKKSNSRSILFGFVSSFSSSFIRYYLIRCIYICLSSFASTVIFDVLETTLIVYDMAHVCRQTHHRENFANLRRSVIEHTLYRKIHPSTTLVDGDMIVTLSLFLALVLFVSISVPFSLAFLVPYW